MEKRIGFKRSAPCDERILEPAKARETTVYRVNITQFELSKLLYESEAFSRIELTASAKLFLWALCSHYNPDNETMFPAQATVAKRLGMSSRSAERAAKELKEKGLITYTTKRVNHYVFSSRFFELVGLEARVSVKGAATDTLSGAHRQNVGCGVRQNVALTNKHEQRNKKEKIFFLEESGGVKAPAVNEKEHSDKVLRLEYGLNSAKKSSWKNSAPARSAANYQNNYSNNYNWKSPQKELRSAPNVEETRELLEKQQEEREKAVNPFDFDREQALSWLDVADEWVLRHSKIAQHLIKKHSLSEFQKFIV